LQNYPVDLLRSMLEIYSPSGSEQQLAAFLEEQMRARGFKVRTDDIGNVIGKLGEDGPRILLCGHMDTVPGEIPVRLEGDFLYGRGSVDAKSSLAAMIAGASAAATNSPAPFRVTVAGVVEEERSSEGARALIASGNSYDLAVFGEPSGASNIIIGYKGSFQLHVTCLTKGGHSASPWLSKNSYEEAYEFWRNLKNSVLENDSSSKFSVVTGCVTNAVAGDAVNSIPSHANLVIDVRIPPGISAASMAGRIEEYSKQYQRNREGINLTITFEDMTEPFLGDADSTAVRAFRWAIRKTLGRQPSLVKKTGTSDMNLFAGSFSMPMIAYGPGDSSLDHTGNERISLSEYLGSVQVYANAIQQIASLTRKEPSLPQPLQ
jgi:LysW-gamma-L-lysine carboxypeptidase